MAFPAVSAGVYGWEATQVARIAVATVRSSPQLGALDLVRFVLFSQAAQEAFLHALG